MNLKTKFLFLGPPIAILYAIGVISWSGVLDLISLKFDAKPTLGTVTDISSDFHKSFEYEISVDGKSYRSGSLANQTEIEVGDKVPAVYSKSNPSRMFQGDLDYAINNNLITIALAVLTFTPFTILIIHEKFPNRS